MALRLRKESESWEETVKRLTQRRAEAMEQTAKVIERAKKSPKWRAGQPGIPKDAYTPWPEDKLLQIETIIKSRIPGDLRELLKQHGRIIFCVEQTEEEIKYWVDRTQGPFLWKKAFALCADEDDPLRDLTAAADYDVNNPPSERYPSAQEFEDDTVTQRLDGGMLFIGPSGECQEYSTELFPDGAFYHLVLKGPHRGELWNVGGGCSFIPSERDFIDILLSLLEDWSPI